MTIIDSTTSTTAVVPPTTTTTAAEQFVVLRPDGLGDIDFGSPVAEVMEELVALLGPPDPGEEYPYEGFPLRHVYWESVGLAVVFSDYEFYRDDGVEHLAGWDHGPDIGRLAGWETGPSSAPLQTVEGIGIGSTLADLEATYGTQLELIAECDPGGLPNAAYVQGRVSSIRFYFEYEEALEPTSPIVGIGAGAGPGC